MTNRYNEMIIKCDKGYKDTEQENEDLKNHFEFCARCGARLFSDGKDNLVCIVCNINGQHEDPFKDLFSNEDSEKKYIDSSGDH